MAGGRFREPYYWILKGLQTRSSYSQISRNTIVNFLDFLEL